MDNMFVNNRLERSITMSKVIRYEIKESIDLNGDSVKYTLVNKDNQNIHYGKICPTTVKAAKFLKEINESGKDFNNEHLFIDKNAILYFSSDNILSHIYIIGNTDVTIDANVTLDHVSIYNTYNLILGPQVCKISNSCLEDVTIDRYNVKNNITIKNSILHRIFAIKGNVQISNSTILNPFGKMVIEGVTTINKSRIWTDNHLDRIDTQGSDKANSVIANSKIDHIKVMYSDIRVPRDAQFEHKNTGIRIRNSHLSGFFLWAPLKIGSSTIRITPIHIKQDALNNTFVQPDPTLSNKDINKQALSSLSNSKIVYNNTSEDDIKTIILKKLSRLPNSKIKDNNISKDETKTIIPKALYVTGIHLDLNIEQDSNLKQNAKLVLADIIHQYRQNNWQNKHICAYPFFSCTYTDHPIDHNVACLINFCNIEKSLQDELLHNPKYLK